MSFESDCVVVGIVRDSECRDPVSDSVSLIDTTGERVLVCVCVLVREGVSNENDRLGVGSLLVGDGCVSLNVGDFDADGPEKVGLSDGSLRVWETVAVTDDEWVCDTDADCDRVKESVPDCESVSEAVGTVGDMEGTTESERLSLSAVSDTDSVRLGLERESVQSPDND
jgi:hypothetical protein